MTSPAPGGGSSALGPSAVMAAGTVVSRLTGFIRTSMLVAALGVGLSGDVFNIANTVPNMLYILLAGGVFNAVLVPQLVRAIRTDPDGGDAYTNRVITLAGLFLAGASVLLVIAAPWLMRIFLSPAYFSAECASPRDAVFAFARYCLPQVFFYGMFVLVGQILNSRRRFGPMMWAPIANNVIAIAVLGIYLATYGKIAGDFTGGEEALLGLGSTLGIAVQLVVLVPFLRRSGFRFRPRFDFRHTGLGHTLKLGTWTVLFVVANQIAYTVVVRIASGGTAHAIGHCGAGGAGTGYTVYANAFLLVMVPHSVITVSLATAVLPRLSAAAAAGDLTAVARQVSATLRTTYAAVLPLMALLPVIATDAASLAFGWGRAKATFTYFVPTLSLFCLGLVFFTLHYLMLRGFYALEQTRRVFHIQCVVAAVNIVAAIVLTHGAPESQIAPRLVIAYTISYAVGAAISVSQLGGQLNGFDAAPVVRFTVRMTITVAIATAVAWLVLHGMEHVLGGGNKIEVLIRLIVVGAADIGVVLVLARTMRIREIDDLTRQVALRLGKVGARGGL